MFRSSYKRPRDIYDSPVSSTPPTLAKRANRNNRNIMDSDASYDSLIYYMPSDSPSNPFRRFEAYTPPILPQETPVADHLILRFKLLTQGPDVHRIVVVPANFTFWHLSRLTKFLFNWKDYRIEKNPYNLSEKVSRKVEQYFTIHRRILVVTMGRNAGQMKDGKACLRVAGNTSKHRKAPADLPWEREERYTLDHLWHSYGNGSDSGRGVVYEYDAFSKRAEHVHITLHTDAEKVRAQLDLDETSNLPLVISGRGLPNDDDDDDDFALDLQQWNEPHAFENYVLEQEEEEEQDEPVSPSVRLAQEQAIVRKRMSGPLPKRLPIDEDNVPDPEEEDQPPRLSAKKIELAAPEPEPVKRRISKAHHAHFDDEENEEPAPIRRHVPLFARKSAAALPPPPPPVKRPRMSEPQELFALGADDEEEVGEEEAEEDLLPPPPPKRRMRAMIPDPEESVEVPGREQVVHHAAHGVRGKPARLGAVAAETHLIRPMRRQASPVKMTAAAAPAPRRTSRRSILGELEQLAAESPDDAEV